MTDTTSSAARLAKELVDHLVEAGEVDEAAWELARRIHACFSIDGFTVEEVIHEALVAARREGM